MKRWIVTLAVLGAVAGCGSSGKSVQPGNPDQNNVPQAVDSYSGSYGPLGDDPSAINSFSPAPATSAAIPQASATLRAVSGVTVLLNDPTSISALYPRVQVAECSAQGEDPPISTRSAWTVDSALVCADTTPQTTWMGHTSTLDVFWPSPVTQDVAVATIQKLLPTDATNPQFAGGTNNDATDATGSCEVINWSSPSSTSIELALQPDWTGMDGMVDATLYTGHVQDDGSHEQYTPNVVREALVGIEANNQLTC